MKEVNGKRININSECGIYHHSQPKFCQAYTKGRCLFKQSKLPEDITKLVPKPPKYAGGASTASASSWRSTSSKGKGKGKGKGKTKGKDGGKDGGKAKGKG
eukprot:6136617-Karenia_brevis.AAC.1